MSLALYMDEHVPKAITLALRIRGVDVLTAQEDDRRATEDAVLLDRATQLGRVIFSFDADHAVPCWLPRRTAQREVQTQRTNEN